MKLERTAPPIAPHRIVLPREHGALAYLLVPLTCALALGRPSAASLALALAAIAGLLAHEPLMVLLGHRGARPVQQHRTLAVRTVAGCAAVTAVGLLIAADALRREPLFMLVPALLSLSLLSLAFTRRERSTLGELLAAAALSSWCIPLAHLGGAAPRAAWLLGAGFAVAFGLATLAVRSVIAAHRRQPRQALRRVATAAALLALAALRALAMRGAIPHGFEVALWPAVAFALVTAAAAFHPRHLMRLGFANLGVSLLVAALLFAALGG